MDILDEAIGLINQAESFESGNRLGHGDYVTLVEKLIIKESGDKSKPRALLFIVEFYIESALPSGLVDPATQQPLLPSAVGSTVGVISNLLDKRNAGGGRAFVLAVLQRAENKADPALSQEIAEKMKAWAHVSNPLRGLRMRISTSPAVIKSGKNAGQLYPRQKFTLCPGQTRETLTAGRAFLDARAAGTAAAIVGAQPPAPAAVPQTAPQYVAPPTPAAPPAGLVQQYAPPPAPPAAAPAQARSGDPLAGLF